MISPASWIICGLLAILALLGAYEGGTHAGDEVGAARVQSQWDKAKLQQTVAAEAEEAVQRNKQQRIDANNLRSDDANHAEVLHLQADLSVARDAGDRLQSRLAAATAARDRAIREGATTAAISAATGTAAGVLADVPGRLIAATRLYADVAGQRGAAGTLCERRYDGAQQAIDAL